MPRSTLAFVLLIGLLMGAAGISYLLFRGGGVGEPASAIPADVGAALIVPSVPALLKDLATTSMAPAPGESGWDLLSEIISALLEARGISYDPDPAWLSRSLRGGVALGWLNSERHGEPERLILAAEMPARLEPILSMVEQSILPELSGSNVKWKRRSHRGHEYGTLRFPGAAESVCVSSVGRIAVVTVSGQAMREALGALLRREVSLPTDNLFQRIRHDLRERSDLIAYFSGPFLASAMEEREPAASHAGTRLRSLLSLGSLKAAGISMTVGRRGLFRERIRLLAAGTSQTLAGRVFSTAPRTLSVAHLLPRGYPLYLGLTFEDPAAAWEKLPETLAAWQGQSADHVRDRIRGLEEFLGLDFRKDVLDAIGTEVAAAIDPSPGGTITFALKPTDLNGVKRLLARADGLARAAEAYRARETPEGLITTFEHPRLGSARPSYALEGSTLLIADAPEPIEAALREARAKSEGSLEGKVLSGARLDAGHAHLAAAADTAHVIEWIRHMAHAGGAEGRGAAWLSRLQDLLPGSTGPLAPSTASFRIARDGLTGEWKAPVSPVILAALFLAQPSEPAPQQEAPTVRPAEPDEDDPAVIPSPDAHPEAPPRD